MRRNGWLVLGLVLTAVGVGLFVTVGADTAEFGWFAYTPGTGELDLGSDLVILTRTRLAACVVGVVGLLVLAAALGHRAGRRSHHAD